MTDRTNLVRRFLNREVTVITNNGAKVRGKLVAVRESKRDPGHAVDLLLLATPKGFALVKKWDVLDTRSEGEHTT